MEDNNTIKPEISWDDFQKVDMRIGRIIKAEPFPEAKIPSYKLQIDFGLLGTRKTSAHITNYTVEELAGKYVVAVVNFPKKQVGKFMSEVLVLGAITDNGVILLMPTDGSKTKLGDRIA